MCQRREGRSKVEQQQQREEADVRIIEVGSSSVKSMSVAINLDDIVDALTNHYEAFLLIISVFSDQGSHHVVHRSRKHFVVAVFPPDAALHARTAESSSDVPFAGNIPRESLKPAVGWAPAEISINTRCNVWAPMLFVDLHAP